MSDISSSVKDPKEQQIIEHYFDLEPHDGESKARQTIAWLAFEHANGLMSERVFTHLVWLYARRIGYPYELAKIRASVAVAAFGNRGCDCKDLCDTRRNSSIVESELE